MKNNNVIAAAAAGEGGAEHASERTVLVRERARAEANARLGGRRR